MSIKSHCPNCGSCYRVPEDGLGRKARCNSCAVIFLVVADPRQPSESPCPAAGGDALLPSASSVPVAAPANRPPNAAIAGVPSRTSKMLSPAASRSPWRQLTALIAMIALTVGLAMGSLWFAGTHEADVTRRLTLRPTSVFSNPFAPRPPGDLPKAADFTRFFDIQGRTFDAGVRRENGDWYILVHSWFGRLRTGLYLGIGAAVAAFLACVGSILALRRVGRHATVARVAAIGVAVSVLMLALLSLRFWAISNRMRRDEKSLAVRLAWIVVDEYIETHHGKLPPDPLPNELTGVHGPLFAQVQYTRDKAGQPSDWILLSPKDCRNTDDPYLAVVMCAYQQGHTPRLRLLSGAEICKLMSDK